MVNHSTLEDKARNATASLLGLFEAEELLESLCRGYQEICEQALARFGVPPRSLNNADRMRLTFEVTCFAAFLAMGQEIPNLTVRGRSPWGDPPDDAAILYFNTKLIEYFTSEFQIRRIADIREIVNTSEPPEIKFGPGEPLNFAHRLGMYLKADSTRKAFELFPQQFVLSLDPYNYAVLKMYGMQLIEGIVDLTRETLVSVFDSECS